MIYENLSLQKVRWIEKIASFNFTIHYQPGVKMDHMDFTFRMDMFLPKDSTNTLTSTLKEKLSDYT